MSSDPDSTTTEGALALAERRVESLRQHFKSREWEAYRNEVLDDLTDSLDKLLSYDPETDVLSLLQHIRTLRGLVSDYPTRALAQRYAVINELETVMREREAPPTDASGMELDRPDF